MNYNISSSKGHCAFCFQTIIAVLQNKKPPSYPLHLEQFEAPLFVTWQTQQQTDELRGCIGRSDNYVQGTFQSAHISKNLSKYAIISAFQDSRFDPIQINELSNLKVSVSVLINFEDGKDAFDWEVGKHGITICFEIENQSFDGTFLPEVAKEQNWDKETTLENLVRKTGSQFMNCKRVQKELENNHSLDKAITISEQQVVSSLLRIFKMVSRVQFKMILVYFI